MNKYDIYLYDDCNVLKNKFGVKDEKKLDLIESNIASTNMSTLYSSGFSDFSPKGMCYVHKTIFGDVYEWAGQYRDINIKSVSLCLQERVFGTQIGILLTAIWKKHGKK